MKKLHGNIGFHIGRGGDGMRPYIRITDRLSGCTILEAELTFDDYANGVLTNCHDVPCVIELNDIGPVGKKRQHKTEVVWVPNDYGPRKKELIREALTPFEVDGWKGNEEDCRNSHLWIRRDPPEGCKHMDGNWCSVSFVRWVEPTEEDIKKAAKSRY